MMAMYDKGDDLYHNNMRMVGYVLCRSLQNRFQVFEHSCTARLDQHAMHHFAVNLREVHIVTNKTSSG